jgi:hypothetical protein
LLLLLFAGRFAFEDGDIAVQFSEVGDDPFTERGGQYVFIDTADKRSQRARVSRSAKRYEIQHYPRGWVHYTHLRKIP